MWLRAVSLGGFSDGPYTNSSRFGREKSCFPRAKCQSIDAMQQEANREDADGVGLDAVWFGTESRLYCTFDSEGRSKSTNRIDYADDYRSDIFREWRAGHIPGLVLRSCGAGSRVL